MHDEGRRRLRGSPHTSRWTFISPTPTTTATPVDPGNSWRAPMENPNAFVDRFLVHEAAAGTYIEERNRRGG